VHDVRKKRPQDAPHVHALVLEKIGVFRCKESVAHVSGYLAVRDKNTVVRYHHIDNLVVDPVDRAHGLVRQVLQGNDGGDFRNNEHVESNRQKKNRQHREAEQIKVQSLSYLKSLLPLTTAFFVAQTSSPRFFGRASARKLERSTKTLCSGLCARTKI
jgi:hypothetical protein